MTRCLLLALALVATCAAADVGRNVRVGNLIYAGDKTSVCFSDRFLTTVQAEAGINTEKRMTATRLGNADELFATPFVVMTGQKSFTLPEDERYLLRQYLENGGFLLASAGCSSSEFASSFRSAMTETFGADCLQPIPRDHVLFATLFELEAIPLKNGGQAEFEGLFVDGRLVCLFSKEGLNDTAHTQGCCCCGGNEVKVAEEVNANALVYALVE